MRKRRLVATLVICLVLITSLALAVHIRRKIFVQRISRTMIDMHRIAVALELYANDHGGFYPIPPGPPTIHKQFPVGTDLQPSAVPTVWPVGVNRQTGWLRSFLSPQYILEIPELDGWGNQIRCDVSADGREYTIISFARDGILDRTFAGYGWDIDNVDSDLIYTGGIGLGGTFISAPEGATH